MRPTEPVTSGDAELCAQSFGDPADPAVLLIAGAASPMDRWEPAFCERLAAEGRFVIRYDLRDTGQSSFSPAGAPDYTGDDLAADALAVLDHFEVRAAHLVGISLGGGLAQRVAVDHPERVLSATLMSTTPAGPRVEGGVDDLPPMSDELAAMFSGEGGDAADEEAVDWSDRDAVVAFMLDSERPFAGGRGVDEDELREVIGISVDRARSLASGSNHLMLESSPFPREGLAAISVPTLVIHGSDDPLFPPAHGEALAAAIPGAALLLLPGIGHEFPRSAWDEVLPAITAVTSPR